ncbi:transcription factor PAR1 [Prosopis cineraria]|uniref:transcription factor PAR1 n=1 Tax=Prosopis cineraria TaxID=364024 RepID=UPI0024103EE9|nr:transcription factor PAR1 [Prosopis cineraria]
MEEPQNSEQTHIPILTFPSKPDNASVPHIPTGDVSLRPPHHRRRRSRDQPSTATSRKKTKTKTVNEDDQKVEDHEDEEEEEEEREEIEKKIEALQRIVPGGESLEMDKLFDETAGYIMALQYQIKGLRALSNLFERLEKEKSKLGG